MTLSHKHSTVFFLDFADSLENADRVGSVERIIRYFNALSGLSFDVNVVSPDYRDYSARLTGRHYPLPLSTRINRHAAFLLFSPIFFFGVMRKADLYWAKFSSALPAVFAKKLFGKPVVNYFDYNWVELSSASKESGMEYRIKQMIEGLMIRNSDYFITTTDTLKSYLIGRGFRDHERIWVIPNNVDTDLFRPSNRVAPGSLIRILSVGRLSEQKNFPLLIRGIARFRTLTDREVRLTIVGAGPLKKSLLSEANDLGVALSIVERIPNSGMPAVYCEHDVFVMTSPREGHPRALIEAMSCGLPVVGTDVTGIRDVISDGQNGLLCAEKADDVAAGIYTVIHEPELAASLGRNARSHALRHYSFKALLKRESDVFLQAVRTAETSEGGRP